MLGHPSNSEAKQRHRSFERAGLGVSTRRSASATSSLCLAAARVYAANRAAVPAMADRVIACAASLGGTPARQVATRARC